MKSSRVLALGFLCVILVGAGLLSLPVAAQNANSVGFFSALFTSVSATCVTGLTVIDPGTQLSLFGQCVLLMLIQVGGLGFMLFVTAAWVALGKRVSLQSRLVLTETMSMPGLSGGVKMTLRFLLFVFSIEIAGALLLAVRFIPKFGVARGAFFGLFHSVSAFCNAGFDLLGNFESLTGYADDAYVLIIIALLIILGGLGFAVLVEFVGKRGRFRALTLHSKLVLSATSALLALGFVVFLLTEKRGALFAFFQSVTLRTAGFDAAPQSGLTDASKFISICLMLIGASPASTGGGIKTTTFTLLLLAAASVAHKREDVNAFGKRLPTTLIRTALVILLASVLLLVISTTILTVTEAGNGMSFIDLMFETASALGTVGLSSAGTPQISAPGRCVLMVCMFIGRVGPMTVLLSLAGQDRGKEAIRYPEESIIIG